MVFLLSLLLAITSLAFEWGEGNTKPSLITGNICHFTSNTKEFMFAEKLGPSKGQNCGAVASFAFTAPFSFVCLESTFLAFPADSNWFWVLCCGWAFVVCLGFFFMRIQKNCILINRILINRIKNRILKLLGGKIKVLSLNWWGGECDTEFGP